MGSLGAVPATGASTPATGPSWDLPAPPLTPTSTSGPRPRQLWRIPLEVLVILAVTAGALWLLAPDWVLAVADGTAELWPVPDRALWAAAVPVLGVAVVVLVRRTGRPDSEVSARSAAAGSGVTDWSRPGTGGPLPTATPAWSATASDRPVAAGPVEVPRSWLPPAAAAPPSPAPIQVPLPDAVERTQVRAHPPAAGAAAAPGGAGWLARLDDGTEIVLDEPVVIGRNPALAAGESVARLVPVADPSISKTHLRLDPGPDLLTVVDRHSTNGVEILDENGTVIDCAPGAPTAVPDGGTIRFGDRALVLHRRG